MKNIILFTIVFIVIFMSIKDIEAQEMFKYTGGPYKLGLGVRAGLESGLTLKYFMKSNAAIEVILSRGWNYGGARVTGLYEIQKRIADVKGLSWFYGIGAHIGYYNGNYYGYTYHNGGYYDNNGHWHNTKQNNYATVGIDGILGLEYAFSEIPFTLGLDIKPYFNFNGGSNRFTDGAFSVRYVIR